ncbi:hypothetical protein M413DRAFT_448094 [Hebeloma cylindrosporum]|uniref:Uncharacterized protein n=1 Tax=Hebeloma cylindrosporum TaxID=76867 RepID=A0A0C2YAM6_HEBCY|nr:hypothetical protein M413DRAFT_448094 [Hebeloma cylindrosporum h7]
MADTTIQEGDQGQWDLGSGEPVGVEVGTEGETGIGEEVLVNASPDNPEGSGGGEQPSELTQPGEEGMGETSEKDAVGEVQETEEETGDEGDKTKEGQPAKVGEKRERETEGQAGGVSGEEAVVEGEAGKEAKKAKTGEGEEAHHEGKKKRGRPAKAKATKPKPASSEGKKRPVGRPRKATIAHEKGEMTMEESGDPAHHTRSKDPASTRA